MINGLEGIPGSGKSYESVVYHVLPALKSGRKVITNLPLLLEAFRAIDTAYADLIEIRKRTQPVLGTWDAYRIDDNGDGQAFELDEHGEIHHPDVTVPLFGHVWDFYTTWRHPQTGHGPLFIIDECHVSFPKMGTDKHVIEWFKLHRHFNVDVLLMTQTFRDVCPSIAALMGFLVKCRKADILGRKDSYIRKVHGGYRGAVVSTEERPYKAQFFPLYKSHTQGIGVAELGASDVSAFTVRFNRFKNAFLVFTLAAVLWAFWPADEKKKPTSRPLPPPAAVQNEPAAPRVSPPQKIEPTALQGPAAAVDQPVSHDGEMPEPFYFKGLHLTGVMKLGERKVYTFAISHNAVYGGSITHNELQAMGYHFEAMTECSGVLTWKNKVRVVICDAPRAPESLRVAAAAADPAPVGPSVSVLPNTWDRERITRSYSGPNDRLK